MPWKAAEFYFDRIAILVCFLYTPQLVKVPLGVGTLVLIFGKDLYWDKTAYHMASDVPDSWAPLSHYESGAIERSPAGAPEQQSSGSVWRIGSSEEGNLTEHVMKMHEAKDSVKQGCEDL